MAATATASRLEIRPQVGPQEDFLSSSADIAIAGGAAGIGKTFALLLEPLRHITNKNFGAVIFRRESPQITNEGGLWDESEKLYPLLRAIPRTSPSLEWVFPSGAKVRFAHMQHEKNKTDWDGSQIPLIGFDQLEHFHAAQFWYLFSRNRSMSGVQPYIRATCNPVPEDDPTGGWLNTLVSWWIDQETGYPIWARSGVLRWFVRLGDEMHWADSREALLSQFASLPAEDVQPKSLTFIPGKLEHNPALMKADPGYRANLLALPYVERERLLGGNWKIRAMAGTIFNRTWFKTLPAVPADVTAWVRYFDKAGTQDGGKFTAGALVGKRSNGKFLIAHMVRGQWSAANREAVMLETAKADRARFGHVSTWVETEPGSSGKESTENTVRNLAGFVIRGERVTGSKLVRASPLAAQAEVGNVDVLQDLGPAVNGVAALEAFLNEAQNFDGVKGFSDQIDAAGGAFNKLTTGPQGAREVAVNWG